MLELKRAEDVRLN